MKRLLYILLIVNISILFTGCKNMKSSPILYKEAKKSSNNISNDDTLPFEIEKISYSKSYQNIEPKVELVKKNLQYKLLASFGLIDSSGIEIKKITRNDKDITIYAANIDKKRTNNFVVPQALINLEEADIKNLDSFKFNIVNMNYDNIRLKLDANEAINKINSHFSIVTNTLPHIDIVENDDSFYWQLEYTNILDKSYKDSPLINLSVQINASTGEITEHIKEPVSSYIDNGDIMDFAAGKYIIYRKVKQSTNEKVLESLWSYDLRSQDKKIIYTSDTRILSAKLNPSSEYIALLESNGSSNQVQLIDLPNFRIQNIVLKEKINPSLIKWRDRDNIYLVHKGGENTLISNYNRKNNSIQAVAETKKNILNLEVRNNYFLILEADNEKETTNICLSNDLKESIFHDLGHQAKFLNDGQIAYLKNDPSSDLNKLYIYDIRKDIVLDTIDTNISNFAILSENLIALVEKNHNSSTYTLHEYDPRNRKVISMVNLSSNNINLNLNKNTLYINSSLPFGDKESQIIYSLDLSRISNTRP